MWINVQMPPLNYFCAKVLIIPVPGKTLENASSRAKGFTKCHANQRQQISNLFRSRYFRIEQHCIAGVSSKHVANNRLGITTGYR